MNRARRQVFLPQVPFLLRERPGVLARAQASRTTALVGLRHGRAALDGAAPVGRKERHPYSGCPF